MIFFWENLFYRIFNNIIIKMCITCNYYNLHFNKPIIFFELKEINNLERSILFLIDLLNKKIEEKELSNDKKNYLIKMKIIQQMILN